MSFLCIVSDPRTDAQIGSSNCLGYVLIIYIYRYSIHTGTSRSCCQTVTVDCDESLTDSIELDLRYVVYVYDVRYSTYDDPLLLLLLLGSRDPGIPGSQVGSYKYIAG